jgi:hypothetical protein
MIRCGMAGDAESRTACSSDVRCRAGLATGKCGTCDPGAAMCAGAELQECSAAGEFSMKTPCASEALCSDVNKSCNPMQCGKDAYKCNAASLTKCKADLSGFEEVTPCKSAELCSEVDKRCNECVPNSKVCAEDTLMVCSADGKGPTATPCGGMTPKCNRDKCVQCKADADCATTMECRVATCNVGTGMCVIGNAPRGTACGMNSKCDLLGGCVQCLADADCSPSQACGLDYRCADRRALTASSSLLGSSCSLALNAGFELWQADATIGTGPIVGTEFLFDSFRITTSATEDVRLMMSGTQARTISVSGMGDTGCRAQTNSDSSATLTFSGSAAPSTVTIEARKPAR